MPSQAFLFVQLRAGEPLSIRSSKLFHCSFFASVNRLMSVNNRKSGRTSNPSLHQRLAQSWCPLGLKTNSSPHSAQTNGSCDTLLYCSAFTVCLQKNPPDVRRGW